MTRIYLVRHGSVENPKNLFYGPEFRLSERGKTQNAELAEDMKRAGVKPVAIVCSPFLRTRDSAEVLSHAFGLPEATVDDRLMEWKVGAWLDRPLSEFYASTHYDTPTWAFDPSVETHAQMAERILNVVAEVRSAHPDQDVIIVSHREPIVSAILSLKKLPFAQVHEIDCPVASVWELAYEGDRLTSLRKAFDRSEDGNPRAMG